jgi:hypothetical protein
LRHENRGLSITSQQGLMMPNIISTTTTSSSAHVQHHTLALEISAHFKFASLPAPHPNTLTLTICCRQPSSTAVETPAAFNLCTNHDVMFPLPFNRLLRQPFEKPAKHQRNTSKSNRGNKIYPLPAIISLLSTSHPCLFLY